jgi:hypothetical protein
MVPVPGDGTADGGGDRQLGPCLVEGMGEQGLIASLNAWGAARDREVLELKINLGATQEKVSVAFDQAKEALFMIVSDFRGEAETLRRQGQYEAAQSIARLEQVVLEARTKFDAQDVRFSDGLNELAQRLLAVDAWAQAEPARVAAIVQAAPAPPWLSSPGGTPITYFPPGPGMRPMPASPPPRASRPQDPWTMQSPTAGGPTTMQAPAPTLDPWAAGGRRRQRRVPIPEGDAH